ncbi:transcription termination factor Rho [Arcanobacterium sp. S3PF19]|uniref:transcription termination factor Rho n=1 Tax=Arcanobacterium sp. S3PF19 TaxID=1219585 RepID=UPI00055423AB
MNETSEGSAKELAGKLLPELKRMAADLGIKMPIRSRKADYVAAIAAHRDGARSETPEKQEKEEKRENTRARSRGGSRRQHRETMTPEEKQAALDALGDVAERRAESVRGKEEDDSHERFDRRARRTRRDRRERRERTTRDSFENSAEQEEQQGSAERGRQGNGEDTLIPVAGILDVSGNNWYIRTGGYLPGKNDAYVSQQTIRRFGLRRGDAVVGAVRSVTDSVRRGQRQHKYNPLAEVTAINGIPFSEGMERPEFSKLTPLYPNEMLRMETGKNSLTSRVIDLVAPIGKGQRGLIVSPPKAGKTMVMQQMATAIANNNPDVHLMVVLVDERPEEVTDMQRLVQGEVIASTFDRPAMDHTIVAELAVERAKRLVELGQDVVILLDSLTRLSRAYNLAAPASGRILSGGVDAAALYPPKKFFGAARNIENGGSLTIIASALVETGSKMDEVIFEEFKGTGNMELRLSRELADRRIFPAVDVNASGTRREEQLFSPEELKIVWHMRRALGTLDDVQDASDFLLGRLRKTESNKEFLMAIVKGMRGAGE